MANYKKIAICATFMALSTSSLFAGKSAGFIGVNVGGSAGAIMDLTNNNVNIGTGVALGIRAGYQGFFTPYHGARFYFEYVASLNAPSYAANADAQLLNLQRIGLTHRADLNIDYLFDFTKREAYTIGMYLGFSTGYLLATTGNIQTGGITAGLNMGIRSTINSRHQFEIALKGVGIQYMSTGAQNVFGFNTFIGMNYSFLFGSRR